MTAPKRLPKGTAKTFVGIYVTLDPDLFEVYSEAASKRGITKRKLVEAGIRQELANPTVFADSDDQEELPLKHTA